jgi:DNA-binding response OmpR family regulator
MNKRILVCDDDEGILDMLEIILETMGYHIIPEKNSLNIYNVIEQQRPDLVLLDLWMPFLSGDQVLKTLRKNPETEKLPVIMLSASTDGEKIAAASGADAYIAKPFDMQLLVNNIQRLVN